MSPLTRTMSAGFIHKEPSHGPFCSFHLTGRQTDRQSSLLGSLPGRKICITRSKQDHLETRSSTNGNLRLQHEGRLRSVFW